MSTTIKLFRLVVLFGVICAIGVAAGSARVARAAAEGPTEALRTRALETEGDTIAKLMRAFLDEHVRR